MSDSNPISDAHAEWDHFRELRALYKIASQLSYTEFLCCAALLIFNQKKLRGVSWITPARIAADHGLHVRNVERAMARLKRIGVVSVMSRGTRGKCSELRLTASRLTSADVGESSEQLTSADVGESGELTSADVGESSEQLTSAGASIHQRRRWTQQSI